MEKLECVFCAKSFPLDIFFPFCPECGEPLLVSRTKKQRSFRTDKKLAVEIFGDFLPLERIEPGLTLGEGDTPLLELGRLASLDKMPFTLTKNETVNPTSSFKDRGSVVAVQKAVSLGIKTIGTISTGNMAGSTAAYAAKAGLKSVILVKEDTTKEKILAAGIYGPILVKVKGDYGRLFRKSFEIGRRHGIYFMNSVDPFRIEGYKVTGYEIFLQLGARSPEYVFAPVSAGGHLIGLMRAFLDLRDEGLIRKIPVFVGVQAKGCSPLVRAFSSGKTSFTRFSNPRTIAHAISNPNPPGGNIVLKMLRENKGMLIAVSDAEIIKAQKLLAEREGIFCDPASATVLAGLCQLAQKTSFKPRDRIVLVITGSGLKTIEDLDIARIDYHEAAIDGLEKMLDSVLR
ncbi:MAG: threonine synthase [Candidatus Aminicenantes bacterium]|nr:threonine synthase [Candidatus Aminicenantes bacterium]